MFLKNKNIIFKIRISKVTDYAALKDVFIYIWETSCINMGEISFLITNLRTFT